MDSRKLMPKEIAEEGDRLAELYFSNSEDEDLEEFLKKNASSEYLEYIKKREERRQRFLEQGIIVN